MAVISCLVTQLGYKWTLVRDAAENNVLKNLLDEWMPDMENDDVHYFMFIKLSGQGCQ